MLTRAMGNLIFLSLMGMHKEYIKNASEFESYIGGGQNVYACVAMGDQQYVLQSQIALVCPQKLGCRPSYPIKRTHGKISVVDQKYQNILHNYHLIKNMNST